MSYQVIDLVRERADEHHWELVFDSDPNRDLRTTVWEHRHPAETGQPIELETAFSPDGRIVSSERRRGGITHKCIKSTDAFGSTEVYLEALQMI
ncbi:hypothetical protein [Mycolicibacterium lutetiense]|uniref:Uncharacterized protein n=1 Tax=Mycolicibacterium lutetiense TaxID=1641992 RepID=A0ABS4ZU43_9MYCO|nr:hypothetical protein [Mycolicibacterium lutetiense]MBP2453015.1 hypothetical protein [Mycolicibacterium lutetiense]